MEDREAEAIPAVCPLDGSRPFFLVYLRLDFSVSQYYYASSPLTSHLSAKFLSFGTVRASRLTRTDKGTRFAKNQNRRV